MEDHNKMYKALLNIVHEPVLVIDNNNNVVEYNKRAELFFNGRYEEFLEQVEDVINEAKELKVIEDVEKEIKVNDTTKILLISAHSVNGKLILTIEDKTDEVVYDLVEGIPYPTYILVLDRNLKVTHANVEVAKLLRYEDTSDLINRKITHLIEDSKIVNLIMDAMENKKEIRDMDTTLTVRGHEIPVRLSIKPLYKDGKFIGTVVTFTDIEEGKKLERFMKLLLKRVPHPIHILDENGRIKYATEVFAKLMGYNRLEEVIGKDITDLYTLESIKKSGIQLHQQVIESRRPIIGEDILEVRTTGKKIAVTMAATPIYDNGKLLGILIVMVDITRRKKQEREVLTRLIRAIEELCEGNLHVKIEKVGIAEFDKMIDKFNEFVERLKRIVISLFKEMEETMKRVSEVTNAINQINKGMEQVSSASHQIAKASENLSKLASNAMV